MTDVKFGILSDVELRNAWKDEAKNFTPWLADNLDRLGSELGLQLELVKAEAQLPTSDDWFSADILARNLVDDTTVLIENQLEGSDHRHLGQLMTYLAGLEAKTIIWIARDFREAHLAAVRWLNQHTTEEFAFFAIKLRVVQIGDSALAPMLDVLEQPNTWEKRLQTSTRAAKETSPLGQLRKAYWKHFFETYPLHGSDGTGGASSNVWHRIRSHQLVVSYYIAKRGVGLFVRGEDRVPIETVIERLTPYKTELESALGVPMGDAHNAGCFEGFMEGDFSDPAQWGALSSWMDERIRTYSAVLKKLPLETT